MIKRVVLVLTLLLALAAGALIWLYSDFEQFRQRPLAIGDESVELIVERGSSLKTLATDLASRGWLDRHPIYLETLARIEGRAREIKAGEYRLEPGTTPDQLLDQLVTGRVIQYTLALVEGWNSREVLGAVAEHPTLIQSLNTRDETELMAALGRPGRHPEGRFFPDTYHFPRATTDVEFLRRAMEAMDKELESQWSNRAANLPLQNAEEALILASIVEKETGKASERAAIAGVFVRRLRRNMKLQTDPTVIYGLGESFDGNLRRKDLRTDTPYNTYTRHGLPPTPIAIPGRAAIRAVLHPAEGNALFFVARGDGSHEFSATLEEHNRAVRKYQLKQ